MAGALISKKWKKFLLTEDNYTQEELKSDRLWNDLSQEDIDGFFWNARGDGSLDYYTDLLLDLSDEIERDVGSDKAWQSFRDEVMSYKDIGEAYEIMAPKKEDPVDLGTAHDSPGSVGRQSEKKERELKDKAQELIIQAIDDIKKEFGDVNVDEILQLFNDEIDAYEFTDEE